MRMKEIRSIRELSRTLDVEQRLRRLCLIEDGERGCHYYPAWGSSTFNRIRNQTREAGKESPKGNVEKKLI